MYNLTTQEIEVIDNQLDSKLTWAKDNQALAEQLAMDATKLLSSLDSDSLYIFDSFNQKLFHLLKKLGAIEYSYFESSEGRKQYIFSPNTNYNFIPIEDDLDLLS